MVERMARSLETNWGVMKQDVSKFDGIYRREASLCRQFFEKKPQQYCHLSCLDLLRSTNIPCGNYILAWKKHELESSLWYLVSRISMSMEIVIRISLKNHLNLCFQASKGFRFWVWALLSSFQLREVSRWSELRNDLVKTLELVERKRFAMLWLCMKNKVVQEFIARHVSKSTSHPTTESSTIEC